MHVVIKVMYASSDVNIVPGNAMKFDPLRCRREKKIARVSL